MKQRETTTVKVKQWNWSDKSILTLTLAYLLLMSVGFVLSYHSSPQMLRNICILYQYIYKLKGSLMFDMILKGFLRDHFKLIIMMKIKKARLLPDWTDYCQHLWRVEGWGYFGGLYIYTSCVRRKYRVRVTKNCVTMNTSYNHDIIVI